MPNSKFFGIPFGTSGDRATIPEAAQPSGAISYTQGFGPDYERDPATDPLAKRVPRDETNEFYYQVSNALRWLQLFGVPEWYDVDDDGNDVSYPIAAHVRHLDQTWVSLVASNTATPGSDLTKWVPSTPLTEAAQSVVNLGSGTAYEVVTPRRLGPAVQLSPWNYATAGGTANALTIAPAPAVAANVAGMEFRVLITQANTGAATLKVGSAAALPIQTIRGQPLASGDLPIGATIHFVCTGTAWMFIGLANSEVVQPVLVAPTFWIRTDGNDNNDGSANTAGAAFATIAGALAYVKNRYGSPGRPIIFRLGNTGTYATTTISGIAAGLTIQGDVANQDAYILQGVQGLQVIGTNLTLQGVRLFFQSGATQHNLQVGNGGNVVLDRVTFAGVAQNTWGHVFCAAGGTVLFAGTTSRIVADARAALWAIAGGTISFSSGSVIDFGSGVNPTFGLGTAVAQATGVISVGVGSFLNTAIGPRYLATLNGVIDVNGGGGNFIPGNAAGSVATGGQYA